MRSSWAQPSLSRDFALLSLAILFILFLISTWVTYTTYASHSEYITKELEKEAKRIDYTLGMEMESANYLLTALGRQIVLDPDRNLTRLAGILKSFDSKYHIYSIFSWDSPEQKVVVSSNRGVLDKPVDVSDRDYVKKAFADPWKMTIGRPIEGRVSGHWVIPVAMGITDYTGKFIGTIQISLDINVLTERISKLVKRDGVSFAIVSKTLIPLTQVSDDKDFVSHNFPTQTLVNVNFMEHPSGLISRGSLFWGDGTYAYYHVSNNYPYLILLGYDTRYSDETVRNMLWARLLQLLVMGLFFVLFLWIVRGRIIKPVLDMTVIAAAVAKGEEPPALPKGGPMEIEGLGAQVKRVGEYIAENRRIEDEMRNKMFMLKKAKERAEMDRRSKSEFLAYVCQEMHVPLNNIVGYAQVMKDQLYGPIENRKYRQYASDIYGAGNTLLDSVQSLLNMAKAETDYIELSEKPVDVGEVIQRALRLVTDRLQAEKLGIKVKLQDRLPKLLADEFRLQEILMNLLLYALRRTLPGSHLLVEARTINENRDRAFFAIVITPADQPLPQPDLAVASERMMAAPSYEMNRSADVLKEPVDLSLELAKSLVALHNGLLEISTSSGGSLTIIVLFGSGRMRAVESISDGDED